MVLIPFNTIKKTEKINQEKFVKKKNFSHKKIDRKYMKKHINVSEIDLDKKIINHDDKYNIYIICGDDMELYREIYEVNNFIRKCIFKYNKTIEKYIEKTILSEYDLLNIFYYSLVIKDCEIIKYIYPKIKNFNYDLAIELLYNKFEPDNMKKYFVIEYFISKNVKINPDNILIKRCIQDHKYDIILNNLELIVDPIDIDIIRIHNFTDFDNYEDYRKLVIYLYENELIEINDDNVFKISYHDQ